MSALARLVEGMALNNLAFKMKDAGWAIDQKARAAHSERLGIIVADSRAKFQTLANVDPGEGGGEGEEDEDGEVNMGASRQLQVLFYDQWGCKRQVNPKTGQVTLDKNSLKEIIATGPTQQARDAARELLRNREASKSKTTYVDRLDPAHPKTYLTTGDGLLHSDPSVIQAATGRWSWGNPNLQNIQKPTYKVVNGKTEVERPGMRDMFVAKPGLTLVEGDYSQLELRVIALLAGDPILLQMYDDERKLRLVGRQVEFDMHTTNAKNIFGLTREPTKNERTLAKNFVYGSNYGGSARTVWKVLVVQFPSLTEIEVLRMQDRWFKAHPWLVAFRENAVRQAKQTGRVIEVLSGREFVFYLHQVKPTEPGNYLVQGFAAALMNRATVRIDYGIRWDDNEAMLAQIHDAAILEGREPKRLGRLLVEAMTEDITYNGNTCHFPIDLKEGQCWGTMK